MPRITHISLKVDDLESASALYESVFGFKYFSTAHSIGHVSRNLSDGDVYLTLMQYESEQSPEALLAGPGPVIHHFGVEVDNLAAYEDKLRSAGCEIISGSVSKPPIKFRTPAGIVAELLGPDTMARAGTK